jgi:O-acetyl-ADP-ribose deacetylase (regulator of RNase III)
MSGINAANQSGGFFSAFSAKLKDKIKLVLDKADELKMRQVALPALGKGEVRHTR